MAIIVSICEAVYVRCVYTWVVCWILFVLTWPKEIQIHSFASKERSTGHQALIKGKIAIDPYTQHKLPVLKMCKRQIKNFRTGSKQVEATLTLVYTSNEPVDIQWFQVIKFNNEEIMHPILSGHPYYEKSALQSGDVTASTLTIPVHFHAHDHTFETVLTNKNATMQYQLKTTLRKKIVYRLDDIDSPEWLVIPPHQSHLSQKQTFQRHCRSFTRLEKTGNALILMHAPPVYSKSNVDRPKPEFRKMVQTHDSGQEYHVEEEGTMILKGEMHRIEYRYRRPAGIFDVKAKQPNVEHVREGIYLCSVERYSLDKLHLLSYVSIGRHQTLAKLLPSKPSVELATCATSNYNMEKNVVVWQETSVGCIRCRSFGYPKPDVEIRRKYNEHSEGTESIKSEKIQYSKFTNVAEAGVVEATYMFRDIELRMAGYYVCTAGNINGGGSIFFQIKVNPIRY